MWTSWCHRCHSTKIFGTLSYNAQYCVAISISWCNEHDQDRPIKDTNMNHSNMQGIYSKFFWRNSKEFFGKPSEHLTSHHLDLDPFDKKYTIACCLFVFLGSFGTALNGKEICTFFLCKDVSNLMLAFISNISNTSTS